MSSSSENLENVPINLNFYENSRYVEIEQLFELWIDRTDDIASGNYPEEADQIISKLHYENVIPFFSEDDQGENASIQNLKIYLQSDGSNRYTCTWAKRLKACISIAKGLCYLHSGVGDHGRVIHGNIHAYHVLLNENLEAKICEYFRDPVYQESNILNIESDVYSYGILMFEILTGMDPGEDIVVGDYTERKLINLVRRFYGDGPERLIDPYIIYDVDRRSFQIFMETAYKCMSFNIKDRPTMDEIVNTIEGALDVHVSLNMV
ncbi:protein kinase, ATP binding site-containing protein [Tanacetum coccineum]